MRVTNFKAGDDLTNQRVSFKELLITALLVGAALGLVVPAWANDAPNDHADQSAGADKDGFGDELSSSSAGRLRLEADTQINGSPSARSRTDIDIRTNLPAEVQINGEDIDIPADGHIDEDIENDGSQTSLNLNIDGQTTNSQDGELDVRIRQRSDLDYESETEVKQR
jgi:hypothetical protein